MKCNHGCMTTFPEATAEHLGRDFVAACSGSHTVSSWSAHCCSDMRSVHAYVRLPSLARWQFEKASARRVFWS